ncbi:MAG: NADH-quinone oxidoreductase subunit C [Actinomycetia bacterium]|nr:NADH-quinone oxidoreductase subunit C [Actinomycetes bacterium]
MVTSADRARIQEVLETAGVAPVSLAEESFLGLVLRVGSDQLLDTFAALKASEDLAFEQLIDLFGADLLEKRGAIEVTYRLRSLSRSSDLVVKIDLPAGGMLSSVTDFYLSALLPEREVCEMFGLLLTGHPNPKRLLLTDGVPPLLLKSVPVRTVEEARADELPEGDLSLQLYHDFILRGIDPPEDPDDPLRNYLFAGWLSPEPPAGPLVPRNLRRVADDPDIFGTDHYLLQIGPQHPSTHGALNMVAEMDGETIISSEAHVGNLHRGIEKLAESRRYHQLGTLVDRGDYVGGCNTELAVALAVERLAAIEVPERASWIRVLMAEINRLASHYLWIGPCGLDSGAMGIFLFTLYDRERWLEVLEEITGQRMMFNYVRPGGVVRDITAKSVAMIEEMLKIAGSRLDEHFETLMASDIYQQRVRGVGIVSKEDALSLGATGFVARASGVDWDLRRDRPYAAYDKMDFEVMVADVGDIWSRVLCRFDEMRQSMRIIRQCLDGMPTGDFTAKLPRILRVPEGECYVPVEAVRGEMGVHIYSDGSDKPYRMRYRPPTLYSLMIADLTLPGLFLADAMVNLGSFDFCFGEVDR